MALAAAAARVADDGVIVEPFPVDVSRAESVHGLAARAAELGPVIQVVHTAGVSPVQASVSAIVAVDVLGTAHVLDAFGLVVATGGAGVCIASMAGSMATLDPATERRLALTPTDELADLPDLAPDALRDPPTAYMVAKRANQLRVEAAAASWGRRGARINSVSPGVIATSMGAAELAGPNGEVMHTLVESSPIGRLGTPEDVAAVVAFLVSDSAGFVTGTDLRVDGGIVASLRH